MLQPAAGRPFSQPQLHLLVPMPFNPVTQSTLEKTVSSPNSSPISIFPLPKVKARPELLVLSAFLLFFRNAASSFTNDSAGTVSSSDYFIIQVTAADGSVNFTRINVPDERVKAERVATAEVALVTVTV